VKQLRAFGHRLPKPLASVLFGDRQQFGLVPQPEDACWQEWRRMDLNFYEDTQTRSVGAIVNHAGYEIMRQFNLSGKTLLEVGPGEIHHLQYWQGKPERYVIADIREEMLKRSSSILQQAGINYEASLVMPADAGRLPFPDETFDGIVTFYSLEHLYPLEGFLNEMFRVLKPNGALIGAIPCEGGLGWGLGRYVTSRRWFLKNTSINPDKIICWEHPNFAEQILNLLNSQMKRQALDFWPLKIPLIDLNLVSRFIYRKSDEVWNNSR
jgi:SAM-dependent methyltransferase